MATKPNSANAAGAAVIKVSAVGAGAATKTAGMAKRAATMKKTAAPAQPVTKEPTPAAVSKTAGPTSAKLPDAATGNALKKKDLIDRVLVATGAKKKLVRDIVEATLVVLGDALSKGAMLNIPPFGKAKVSRPQDAASGKAMTVKIRRGQARPGTGRAAKAALADAEE